MEPSIFLFIILLLIVTIILVNFYFRIHEHPKLSTLVSFFIMFNSLLMIFTIYITTQNHKCNNSASNSHHYDSCCNEILKDFFDFFIDNPDMCYFFDEIYNQKFLSKEPNCVMEELCCAKLMTNMTNYCSHYYKNINSCEYRFFLLKNNKKFITFFTLILEHQRAKHYISEYLNKCGSECTKKYFDDFM